MCSEVVWKVLTNGTIAEITYSWFWIIHQKMIYDNIIPFRYLCYPMLPPSGRRGPSLPRSFLSMITLQKQFIQFTVVGDLKPKEEPLEDVSAFSIHGVPTKIIILISGVDQQFYFNHLPERVVFLNFHPSDIQGKFKTIHSLQPICRLPPNQVVTAGAFQYKLLSSAYVNNKQLHWAGFLLDSNNTSI